MNLSIIIVLLQTVLSLLSTPNLSVTAREQANNMASQVVSLATQALSQPTTTQLGVLPNSSISVVVPTSTTQPIVVNVLPQVQQDFPVITNQTLGLAAPIVPKKPLISNGIIQVDSRSSKSITVHIDKTNSTFDSLILTFHCDMVNSPQCETATSTYDVTNSNAPFTIDGLSSGTNYRFDFVATNDGMTTSRNDMGSATSQE